MILQPAPVPCCAISQSSTYFTGNAAKPRRPSTKLISHSQFSQSSGMTLWVLTSDPCWESSWPHAALSRPGLDNTRAFRDTQGRRPHIFTPPHIRSLLDTCQDRQGQSKGFPAFFPRWHLPDTVNTSTQKNVFIPCLKWVECHGLFFLIRYADVTWGCTGPFKVLQNCMLFEYFTLHAF